MLVTIIYILIAVLVLFLLGWFLVKKKKVNLNEYVGHVLAVLCVILAVDRVAELFRVLLTGELATYWSPIGYTLAYFACVAGFQLMCGSPLNVTLRHPVKFFVFFSLCFYGIFLGMTAQWSNEIVYFCLMNLSNFKYIANHMPEVIAPAVAGLSLIIPVSTIRGRWNYYFGNVVDGDRNWLESFEDYGGTKLKFQKKKDVLPEAFECNAPICVDDKTGKTVFIPEKKRFEATLVEGATGTGKTSMIVEPMCANDIERKYFFRELSKKLGYNALQSGFADMTVPYSNDYLNRNFTLSFLKPREGRMKEYKDYMKDMISYVDPETNEVYYRGLGFTLVAPDNACIERVRKVASAYSLDVDVIDPMDPNSYGINPFTGKDPAKVAAIISTVLKGMYQAENSESSAFFANVTQQAFENLAILLKLVYPKMHNGEIPTLEDMLSILNNFDIAEEMCEILKKDPKLSEDYKSLIGYFEKNFYKPPVNIHGYEIATTYGSGRKETEKHVYGAITQLDNFLRNPGVKRVLCSRNNNIDLDRALQNGEIITACTRQGDLGETHQKAFGMFVILSFKDAVLRRPGNENTRTPHFIYIDEFPLYVNKDTEAFFTLFRKYRCGTLITIQNLSQLTKTSSLAYFKDVVITNTKTQIIFGDMTNEESLFWEGELGKTKRWAYQAKKVYDDKDSASATSQTEALMAEKKQAEEYYKAGKIVDLKFKQCIYKTKTASGKTIRGRGMADFINKKYYDEHKCSKYDFQLYADANSASASETAKVDSHFFTGENEKEKMLSSNDDNIVDIVVDSSSIIKKKNSDSNNSGSIDLSNLGDNNSVVINFNK